MHSPNLSLSLFIASMSVGVAARLDNVQADGVDHSTTRQPLKLTDKNKRLSSLNSTVRTKNLTAAKNVEMSNANACSMQCRYGKLVLPGYAAAPRFEASNLFQPAIGAAEPYETRIGSCHCARALAAPRRRTRRTELVWAVGSK